MNKQKIGKNDTSTLDIKFLNEFLRFERLNFPFDCHENLLSMFLVVP